MLVIFGANGMTGIELVREAILKGIPVKPVARNDHDTHRLEDLVDVNDISFADANHPESIKAILHDATSVISCMDARTAGYGSPVYHPEAAANVVRCASEMGIKKILHMSVMGAYRWSPNPLNRHSFHLDIHVRRLKVPWTMLRISCYHDEIIDSHVRPPDGGSPHQIKSSARYSPVSRRDTAKVVLNILPTLIPNRTWLLGGPIVYAGKALENAIKPYKVGSGKKTLRGPLPHGDMSVATETSEIMVGWVPTESLEWTLDPRKNPIEDPPAPFWNRPDPRAHHTDQGEETESLRPYNTSLRYAVHEGLFQDLRNLGISGTVQFDFSEAVPIKDGNIGLPHKAELMELDKVKIIQENTVVHQGRFDFIYDDLADDFQIWWAKDNTLPKYIWDRLDLGVRRRLQNHKKWKTDEKVLAFAAKSHERSSL
jgi:uncharacterized protein YbjT (DUF2867 family)